MKKRGLGALGIVLIVVAVIIIGYVVYSFTKPELAPRPGAGTGGGGQGSIPFSTCSDSDGGFNILVKGNVTGILSNQTGNQTYFYSDYCYSGNASAILKEYICFTNAPVGVNFNCSQINYTCLNGRCAQIGQ